jgi:hypothetical protein
LVTVDPFSNFLAQIGRAPNETSRRELFVALASTGFADRGFATELALGAEYRVRFLESGLIRRGAVDSFFGNLVIEFEADLARTGAHALDQLRGYVAGAWNADGSVHRAYLAVASDGRRWEVYSPRLRDPDGPHQPGNITLVPVEVWEPSGIGDSRSLRDFLNRLFFRRDLIAPTADNFARDFGVGSPAFLRAREELGLKMADLADSPQLRVRRDLWRQSLEISYGSIEPDDELLVKHTYLAVLARLLVWTALERRHLEERELPGVLSGTYFVAHRIANLVEDDFFRWHEIASAVDATRVWVGLSRHLAGYDLAAIGEDILKPLYEELVDPETRQMLGEFYTPDWLATQLTERLLQTWDWAGGGPPVVVDPACGSGTFLRTTIDRMRAELAAVGGTVDADTILASVMGIDVHPLAVTIARATYLLAIKDLVPAVDRLVTLPVYLANSLRWVEADERPTLFGAGVTELTVGDQTFAVPTEFVWDGPVFDGTIDDVLAVAKAFGSSDGELDDVPASIAARLAGRLDAFAEAPAFVETLGRLARHLADLIRRHEDSVHGFMLKNNYRPAMVRRSFDYVVGNPPWLTVGDIQTADYKRIVVALATSTEIAPRATGEQSHTELATLFLSQAFTEFLRPLPEWEAARVGLVMPRSIFVATHHRHLREGAYKPSFRIVEVWDLDGVRPLFNVPACVILATAGGPKPSPLMAGREYRGVLARKDMPWEEAEPLLDVVDSTYRLAFLAKRSAWVKDDESTMAAAAAPTGSANAYTGAFRQGAILYPQTLLTVTADGHPRRGIGNVAVRTDPRAARSAHLLADVSVDRVVDSDNLYFTAAAENLAPYVLLRPLWVVILPTIADPGDASFRPVDTDALRRAGRVETAGWLEWAEAHWARVRKEGDNTPLHRRLDFLSQFSAQAERERYLVLYTSSGSRPVAARLDIQGLDLPFVARDKTYWASFANAAEADYVTAFLNSAFVSRNIRAWMTRGLFGARDVHKRVLDVPFPAFDPENSAHLDLAALARAHAEQAATLSTGVAGKRIADAREMVRSGLDEASRSRVEAIVEELSRSVARGPGIQAAPTPDAPIVARSTPPGASP